MKILFTGGGSGGHFYPIIAIAQEIRRLATEEKLVQPSLYFMSDGPYNERVLFENEIKFIKVNAGKLRRDYSSASLIKNFLDLFKTLLGSIQALFKVFSLYPDIVVGKGGYASFPTLLASRILRIPVLIHESDSHPGLVTRWAGKFAIRVALSYPEAAKYFPAEKVAVTGNPLRQEILTPTKSGAHEYLRLDKNLPVIFIIGGSQGASKINEIIVDILPKIIEKYQFIHQVGKNNFTDLSKRAKFILKGNPFADHYKIFDYLDATAMRMTAGVASLVITRAGSSLFEIANWGIPSIVIPIPEEISHDQRTNAFTYARSGGAVVIEEKNLTASVLLFEIDKIMTDDKMREDMIKGAKQFARPEAATTIAQEILRISLSHD
ncbi:MAG TPA: UDP-N-acetylglucosamine--N-acetylmuramyl-(pentapeptide) pyrophosphoryl-undecaprenol N-acetylglucosamine transferase [Candidatus Paceibacterota bacterium]|nr:UDP-N-acetylglucosamine--N-acetylmuramyl-(pentapeptide) pyrophosphoryl-undecaprenol N-acetylglucosamine transferase [Candidatus Paceibacterota bacterium]